MATMALSKFFRAMTIKTSILRGHQALSHVIMHIKVYRPGQLKQLAKLEWQWLVEQKYNTHVTVKDQIYE
jgi:hypothetical protein